jgi:ATP-dependent Lon protease
MYAGYWLANINYRKGDIVFVGELLEYYICIKPHKSNNLTFPNKIDMYWVSISSTFLDTLIKNNSNNPNNPNYTKENVEDDIIKLKPIKTNTILKIITTNLDNYLDDEFTSTFSDNFDKDLKDKQESESKQKKYKRKNNNGTLSVRQGTTTKELSDDGKCADYIEKQNDLKKRLRCIEDELQNHKRRKLDKDEELSNLRDRLLLMNMDLNTKSFVIDKYDNTSKMCGSDYSKAINWIKTVSKIPYGKYKHMPVTKDDSQEKIKQFFDQVKQRLDKNIYGLEDVKQEIMEFVAKKITNPNSRGHVLALYGHAGVGKTKLIRSLADALELPFYQINFGGLNDVSVLTGHSETYVGSKPGKIVDIFTNSEYMNPIVYLDEIDKISENKATEIFGTLTHLLDEEQNTEFQDNYLSNITLDLSKVFFVLAFNDITKVDDIVSDRLKIIYIDPPNLEDKLIICQDKIIPDILNSVKLKDNFNIIIDKEVIEYIISSKTSKESGVRQLRKNIEKIINRLNYDILIGNFGKLQRESNDKNIIITRTYVDDVLKLKTEDTSYLNMYL